MSSEDTPEEATLRAEVAEWMAEHAGKFGLARARPSIGETPEYARMCRDWQAELAEGGWSVVGWPEEYGGRGFTGDQTRIVFEEQLKYAVPVGMLKVAVDMVGPTIMKHGTDDQKATFIDPIRTGGQLWCQLFSEPDAGSDLASLRTSARLEGDEWVVNGQKVWTSGGTNADMGMLLARTDPASWRHGGITYFLVDMRTPGIEVRPLVQINRAVHFNEVFLNEVRIPTSAVVGEVGDGWTVARTTLGAERAMIGSMSVVDHVVTLIERAQKVGMAMHPSSDSPATGSRLRCAVVAR
jgi:alkylation response protein AidB-like acyl-CoA dehydrogenase